VTTDSTATPPISRQRATVQVLADLIDAHPSLPEAYIVVHAPLGSGPGRFDMQLQSPWEFEQWRAALDIPAEKVALHGNGGSVWLDANITHHGFHINVSGFGVRLFVEDLRAPRDREQVPA
jgi:hypothetical protein